MNYRLSNEHVTSGDDKLHSRRLQIKAAVSAEEKSYFEEVARRIGLPLSILIRRELKKLGDNLDMR